MSVVIGQHDGFLVAIGPAATIRPALNAALPVTIEAGEFAGDVVTLRGHQAWRDGAPFIDEIGYADGDTLAAYLDDQALATAPRLSAALAEMERRNYENVQARAAAADVWDRWSQPPTYG